MTKLGEVVDLVTDKVDVRQIDMLSYVTTENMVTDRGGVCTAKNTPRVGAVTKYKSGDVLVSNIRPYFKKIWLANKCGGASNDVLVFRAKEAAVCSKYLYYALANDKFFNYVMASAKGAKMPRGDKSQILKYEIDLPDLATQKKIAATLSAFDDKIELNRQMDKTLEEMGRALFRHYFIDNPEAKNWPMVKVGDLIKPKRGKSLVARAMKKGCIPVVGGGLSAAGVHNIANTTAPVVTIGASGANAGYVSLWGVPVWSSDSSYIDSTVTPYIYYWYFFLKNRQGEIFDMQTGTGQPHIYPSHIELLDVNDTPEQVIAKFSRTVEPLFAKTFVNKEEIASLISARDTLATKLVK